MMKKVGIPERINENIILKWYAEMFPLTHFFMTHIIIMYHCNAIHLFVSILVSKEISKFQTEKYLHIRLFRVMWQD